MSELNKYERNILTVLLKFERFMTTAQVAKACEISWNTAEKHLRNIYDKGWIEMRGERTKYWKAES